MIIMPQSKDTGDRDEGGSNNNGKGEVAKDCGLRSLNTFGVGI